MSDQTLPLSPNSTSDLPSDALTEAGSICSSASEENQTDGELATDEASPLDELEANANKSINDPTYDPLDGPLQMFAMYSGRIMAIVPKLSSRQKNRLLLALITYPLENIEVNKNNKLEHEVFIMADRLLESKYLMKLIMAHNSEQERHAKTAEQKALKEEADTAKEVSVDVSTENKQNNEGDKNV